MNIRIVIAVVIVLLLVSMGSSIGYLYQRLGEVTVERNDALQMANDSGRVARTYINLFGNEVSKNRVIGASLFSLKSLRESDEARHLKQFAGLKKNFSNLETSIRVDAVARFRATLTPLPEGSTPVWAAITPGMENDAADTSLVGVGINSQYVDKYNVLNVTQWLDSTVVTGMIHVPFDGVVYWERKTKFLWFRVGKKIHYSEFTSPNPWVHISQQEVMVVRKR